LVVALESRTSRGSNGQAGGARRATGSGIGEAETDAEEELVASNIGRKLLWVVVGGVATKAARGMTRKALYHEDGAPRLPSAVRRSRRLETALVMAIATGALLAVTDMLHDQGKTSARARPPHPA
jgi:hypothetical protein